MFAEKLPEKYSGTSILYICFSVSERKILETDNKHTDLQFLLRNCFETLKLKQKNCLETHNC